VVNIRADEIVDGNPKLTLGLIWTLILHYQVIQSVLHTLLSVGLPAEWMSYLTYEGMQHSVL